MESRQDEEKLPEMLSVDRSSSPGREDSPVLKSWATMSDLRHIDFPDVSQLADSMGATRLHEPQPPRPVSPPPGEIADDEDDCYEDEDINDGWIYVSHRRKKRKSSSTIGAEAANPTTTSYKDTYRDVICDGCGCPKPRHSDSTQTGNAMPATVDEECEYCHAVPDGEYYEAAFNTGYAPSRIATPDLIFMDDEILREEEQIRKQKHIMEGYSKVYGPPATP